MCGHVCVVGGGARRARQDHYTAVATMGAKGAKKATGAKSKSIKQTPLCARCSIVCVDAARAGGGIAFA